MIVVRKEKCKISRIENSKNILYLFLLYTVDTTLFSISSQMQQHHNTSPEYSLLRLLFFFRNIHVIGYRLKIVFLMLG